MGLGRSSVRPSDAFLVVQKTAGRPRTPFKFHTRVYYSAQWWFLELLILICFPLSRDYIREQVSHESMSLIPSIPRGKLYVSLKIWVIFGFKYWNDWHMIHSFINLEWTSAGDLLKLTGHPLSGDYSILLANGSPSSTYLLPAHSCFSQWYLNQAMKGKRVDLVSLTLICDYLWVKYDDPIVPIPRRLQCQNTCRYLKMLKAGRVMVSKNALRSSPSPLIPEPVKFRFSLNA